MTNAGARDEARMQDVRGGRGTAATKTAGEFAGEEAIALFSRFNTSMAIPMRGKKMVAGDFRAMFELAMARKDVRLMVESAGDQPLIVLPALAVRMDEMIAAGHGKDDLAAIAAPVVRSRSTS